MRAQRVKIIPRIVTLCMKMNRKQRKNGNNNPYRADRHVHCASVMLEKAAKKNPGILFFHEDVQKTQRKNKTVNL